MKRTHLLPPLAVIALFFGAIFPTLHWREFTDGGENGVAGAVLELRRGGPWLVPTLHAEQRTKKPPLAAWIAAAGARPDTVDRLSEPHPSVRHAAYRDLARQIRWPSLLSACLMLAAVYAQGAVVDGPSLGFAAALICGTTLLWLDLGYLATTDVQLALWVNVANVFLAAAVLRGKWWMGCCGAGVAVGLAMMSKGPVSLVQTLLPVVLFPAFLAAGRYWRDRVRAVEPRGFPVKVSGQQPPSYADAPTPPTASVARGGWLVSALVGIALMLLVGFAWYALVAMRNPEVLSQWWTEVTRKGATDAPADPWHTYAIFFLMLFPWIFFFAVGVIDALGPQPAHTGDATEQYRLRAGRVGVQLALAMTLVPLVVMSFFPDRKTRYLLPMAGPAAVVAAWGLLLVARQLRAAASTSRGLLLLFHWLPLAAAALVLPLLGSPLLNVLKTIDDRPWYTKSFALGVAATGVALTFAGAMLVRRWGGSAVLATTVVVMLLLRTTWHVGMRDSVEGRSEMRPLADAIIKDAPGATVYSFRPARPARHAPLDLVIYLNRTVENLPDPSAVPPPRGGPQVLVIAQDKRPGVPALTGGWRRLHEVRRDKNRWYAFVRDGAAPGTP